MDLYTFIMSLAFGFCLGLFGRLVYEAFKEKQLALDHVADAKGDEVIDQVEVAESENDWYSWAVGEYLIALKAARQCRHESEANSIKLKYAREAYLERNMAIFKGMVECTGDLNEYRGMVSEHREYWDANATLLHECIKDGSYEYAQVLIENKADPSLGLKCIVGGLSEFELLNITPLHSAIESGRVDLVELLLAAGADSGVVDGYGFSPLCKAVEKESIGVTKALLAAGADPNYVHDTIMCPLFHAKSPATAQLLVHNGANVNLRMNNGYPILSMLIASGKSTVAQYLIKEHRYVFDFRDNDGDLLDQHPLMVAYWCDDLAVFKDIVRLSRHNNQYTASNDGILQLAVRWNKCAYVKPLLERMSQSNCEIDSGLLYLAKSRQMQEMLILYGADPSVKCPSHYGCTPDEYMKRPSVNRQFVWTDLIERAPRILARHQRSVLADAVGLEEATTRVKRRM
ncbi:ankyrin repeat domain-containing protein [Stenotrophomonas sp. S39]|uniref:ankyrin repeat domain-containing protein n=1 Tax=Stenotrophomonas sp. S39 TaxID=2767451 RepID=UPI00190ADD94|nr:ankyrin repeat domain-containing protein [Stenotrophomonas sp. S39]MBK0052974.1 ankyrin repeat domain-containing protein [Stenotrophomonas sp. S39]